MANKVRHVKSFSECGSEQRKPKDWTLRSLLMASTSDEPAPATGRGGCAVPVPGARDKATPPHPGPRKTVARNQAQNPRDAAAVFPSGSLPAGGHPPGGAGCRAQPPRRVRRTHAHPALDAGAEQVQQCRSRLMHSHRLPSLPSSKSGERRARWRLMRTPPLPPSPLLRKSREWSWSGGEGGAPAYTKGVGMRGAPAAAPQGGPAFPCLGWPPFLWQALQMSTRWGAGQGSRGVRPALD